MLVRQVQQQLSQLDPELELLCYAEDEAQQGDGHFFRLLDIEAVSTTEGEMVRGDDRIPSLRLGKSDVSKVFAILEVTSDF